MNTPFPYLLTLILCLFATTIFAQPDSAMTMVALDVPMTEARPVLLNRPIPSLPAPYLNYSDFFNQYLEYPAIAQENTIEGTVVLAIQVNASGDIRNITVAESDHPILTTAALQAAQKLPTLQPALIRGQAIGKQVLIPLAFSLQ